METDKQATMIDELHRVHNPLRARRNGEQIDADRVVEQAPEERDHELLDLLGRETIAFDTDA